MRKPIIKIMPSNNMWFITDENSGNVWNGANWLGFGYPMDFDTYQAAFKEWLRIRNNP